MKATLKANKGKGPVRVVAKIPADTDLGACTKAVTEARTPHRSQAAPGMAVVLFARLNEDSAEKAQDTLAKVKGVEGAKANLKAGEISVELSGEEKVTIGTLTDALKDAGIEASTAKGKAPK